MSPAGRRVEMARIFLDKLSEFEEFLGRDNAAHGRAFTAAVFAFCYDVIAPLPWAFPATQKGELVRPEVRRAVFKRRYVLLYRVTDTAVQFVDIYHTSSRQNAGPSTGEVDDDT